MSWIMKLYLEALGLPLVSEVHLSAFYDENPLQSPLRRKAYLKFFLSDIMSAY